MLIIPSEMIAACSSLAAIAWLVYARSQRGRWQSGALAWLSLPFFVLSALYAWFSVGDVPIELRGMHARIWILLVSVSQAFVLSLLSYLQRKGGYGKPN